MGGTDTVTFTIPGVCPVEKTKVTAVDGKFSNLCGPGYNLSFAETPTDGVKYVQTRTGNTLKVTPEVTDSSKYELTNPGWSQTKTDDLVACPVEKTKVTAVDGKFSNLCGPGYNLSFAETPTDGVKYVQTRTGNTLKVTPEVTDSSKYELTNPGWSQTKTDDLVACPVEKTKVTAVDGKFSNLCGPGYNLSFAETPTDGVKYVQTRTGNTLKVTPEVTDSSKYELTNPPGRRPRPTTWSPARSRRPRSPRSTGSSRTSAVRATTFRSRRPRPMA
ncbi:hypothetical protein IPL68_03740 [Candidatus Saccharibacteria bacterium]|nr:MAG: hypothetical protein IPL68_03740 [Candidatus Saccharibacteria bacterium]